jgi:hypothetical protein
LEDTIVIFEIRGHEIRGHNTYFPPAAGGKAAESASQQKSGDTIPISSKIREFRGQGIPGTVYLIPEFRGQYT